MNKRTPQFILSIAAASIAFFVVSSVVVFAQGFIGPSQEAPSGNVLDFLSESTEAQGRLGKLRIGSDVIPSDPQDPYVDVLGNVFLQGNASFGQGENGTTLYVSTGTIPTFVGSGTTVANGKFNIQGYLGAGLYAETTTGNHGIFAKTNSAGSQTDPTKAIFGQTTQVATGEASTGVLGITDAVGGAGVFANQANCPGADVESCGYAARFVGNVVVTGNIQGDGRGVFKTWTLNDGSGSSVGSGIAIKTVDFSTEEIVTVEEPVRADGVLSPTERFIAMSVLVNGEPYDTSRAELSPTNVEFLKITFDAEPNTQSLIVERNYDANPVDLNIVAMLFYEQRLEVEITNELGDAVPVLNALVDANTTHIFNGSIGGGSGTFGGGEFTWTLHTDQAGTSPDCQQAAGGTCGEIVIPTGQTTVYKAPAVIPGSGSRVYLKGTWTSDPGLYGVQAIDLYDIQFTTKPANDFVLIGGNQQPITATGTCPGGPCPAFTYSLSGFGAINGVGLYTSPIGVSIGSSWTATIRASFEGLSGNLYRDYTIQLFPEIVITATNESQAAGLTNTWNDNAEVGVAQTLQLVAEAQDIPELYKYDFEWELLDVYDLSENLYNSIELPNRTNGVSDENKNIEYRAPTTINTSVLTQRRRQVRATWMANGSTTASSQIIDIYPGRGPASLTTFSRTINTTGDHNTFIVSGFHTNRNMYSFCSTLDCSNETVIDYSNLPLTIPSTLIDCGTLRFTGMAASTACDPAIQSCTLAASFSYTANGSTCSDTIAVKMQGDARAQSNLKVSSTGSSGCVCNPKTGYCCGPVVDDPLENGGSGDIF